MTLASIRKSRWSTVSVAATLFVVASLLGGIAGAASSSLPVRKFSATTSPCAPKGATLATLTASITNNTASTVGLGSAFFDAAMTNFRNITPAGAFVVTAPAGKHWTAKVENYAGLGGDSNDLDGIYLVANTTADYLGAGQTVSVSFPTTVGTSLGSKTWAVYAWSAAPRTTLFSLVGSLPATTISVSCPAASIAFGQQPTDTAAGAPIAPTVTVRLLDATGNLASAATNSVSLGLNDPGSNGGALSNGGSTAAVGGVASFPTLSINKVTAPGTYYSLTAGSGSFPSVTSNNFSIVPGSASTALFVNPNTNDLPSGTGRTFTAKVVDSNGNLATNFNGVMLFAQTGGPGTITPAITTLAPDCEVVSNGLATSETISGLLQGAVSLTATPAGGTCGALGAQVNSDSTGFNVIPGAPVNVLFTQEPTSPTTVGTPFSPAVTVSVDDGLNPVVTNVALTFKQNPGGAGPLNVSSATSTGGVATFTGLLVDTSSTGYQLTATAGSVSTDSDLFNITSTAPNCNPCTTNIGNGGSTASGGADTTLIVEGQSIVDCDAVFSSFDSADGPPVGSGGKTPPFEGTVTVNVGSEYTPSNPDPVTFRDPTSVVGLPSAQTYPSCEPNGQPPEGISDPHPGQLPGQQIPACTAATNNPGGYPCVLSQGFATPTLDLVTVVDYTNGDPPHKS